MSVCFFFFFFFFALYVRVHCFWLCTLVLMNQEPADPDSEFFWMAKTQNSKFVCKSGFVVVVVLVIVVVGCLFVVFHCCAIQTDRQANEDSALFIKLNNNSGNVLI